MNESLMSEELIKLSSRLENVEGDIKELKEEQKNNTQLSVDLKLLTQTVRDLSGVVQDLKTQSLAMQTQMIEVSNASNREKANKWDGVWDKVLIVIVGAIMGYILTHIGF